MVLFRRAAILISVFNYRNSVRHVSPDANTGIPVCDIPFVEWGAMAPQCLDARRIPPLPTEYITAIRWAGWGSHICAGIRLARWLMSEKGAERRL